MTTLTTLTTSSSSVPQGLVVVPGSAVDAVLADCLKETKGIVRQVYGEASEGRLVNPDSLFLRPDAERRERVIALPAYVPGPPAAMGIKWISSFPENLAEGLPRASALIVLNDPRTGFPVAVLEGARISAHRTALSALVGAEALLGEARSVGSVAVVGTGYISRTTVRVLAAENWSCDTLQVFDLDADRAEAFAAEAPAAFAGRTRVAASLREAVADADLVLLATTATVPHVTDGGWFKQGATVLHMSLRDLTPAALADADHVVDEVSHALREKTSLALAVEQGAVEPGRIRAVGELLRGVARRDPGRTVVYAPFGLGSLDIAVARLVLERAGGLEGVRTVPDFF
ncbi:2,3-diaminopropionate biosynthesis protein SbnB [Streptomyces sp. NPDC005820]|uniref:2,3-diaminopropionate biosynthesis protein SbnB n=1 Tax=Streptomyces sp. NPDC005820 TaxID=3157069 RepID=UPI0033CF9D00